MPGSAVMVVRVVRVAVPVSVIVIHYPFDCAISARASFLADNAVSGTGRPLP